MGREKKYEGEGVNRKKAVNATKQGDGTLDKLKRQGLKVIWNYPSNLVQNGLAVVENGRETNEQMDGQT